MASLRSDPLLHDVDRDSPGHTAATSMTSLQLADERTDETIVQQWWSLFRPQTDNSPLTGEALDTDEHESQRIRERLITHYLPLARIMAGKLYGGRTHNDIEFDDYLQLATIGLIESIDRFDPWRDVQFKTYATVRIRGAILNGLERLTEKQQQIACRQRLRQERAASLSTDTLPDDLDSLFGLLAEVGVGLALGILLEGSGMIDEAPHVGLREQPSYFAHIELQQLREQVRSLVDMLPGQERMVIRLHYVQEMPFADIALELGVSRGRIAQIHRKALGSLRTHCNASRSCDVAW